jgi:uncharacterized membrane protein
MKHLKLFFKKNSTVKHIVIAMAAIALIGFIDATYLAVKHYAGTDLTCGVSGGCNVVTTSEYSQVFGIPVALFGAGYYVSILLLSIGFLDIKDKRILTILKWLPISGLLASAWFVYLQLYVIHAICLYCMGSATTSTLLFLLGMKLLYLDKKRSILNLDELV